MKGYFVTGTDTGVGKTVVSACLAIGLKARYWKPIQSGTQEKTDSEWVAKFLGEKNIFPESYRLKAPLSPHHSSEIEGVSIDLDKINFPLICGEPIVVEGAGGLLVPLNKKNTILDLIQKLKLPCVVVARSGLGTINHSLLTLNELKRQGVEIAGVVLNGKKNERNKKTIEEWAQVKVLLELEEEKIITKEFLEKKYKRIKGL